MLVRNFLVNEKRSFKRFQTVSKSSLENNAHRVRLWTLKLRFKIKNNTNFWENLRIFVVDKYSSYLKSFSCNVQKRNVMNYLVHVKMRIVILFLVTRNQHLLTSYQHTATFLPRIHSLQVLSKRHNEQSFPNVNGGEEYVDLTEN